MTHSFPADVRCNAPLYRMRAASMTTTETTSFRRYKQGYEDGYEGFILAFPDDVDYCLGYEVGTEDDQLGLPHRFDPAPLDG